MTDKLTLEWCFKYPNAFLEWGDDELHRGFIRRIDIKADRPLEVETFPIAYYHLEPKDCKLILRPLSSLTDEEKKKIEKIEFQPSDKIIYSVSNLLDRDTEFADDIYKSNIDVQDYLRSINIDIDGLKERRIVVYE